ncbi:MAG: nickel insertion protein [Pirellulales bacterium]
MVFKETGTLGIRRWPATRHKLERKPHSVETALGTIAGKLATLSDGSVSFSPEFESCRQIATEKQLALKEVYEAAMQAFHNPPASA